MRVSLQLILIFIIIIGTIFIIPSCSFMKGPCKKKRWSGCRSVKFKIVKRGDSQLPGELGEDISDIDWKDVLRRRNGISTRLALLKALKDLRADIVAEIRLKNSK